MRLTIDWVVRFAMHSNEIEGITDDQSHEEHARALHHFMGLQMWDIPALEAFVSTIQPNGSLRRHRGLNVKVGYDTPPPGGSSLMDSLERMYNQARAGVTKSAHYQHIEYERLHPFTDGNGRSGRALWLWTKIHVERDERALRIPFLQLFYYDSLRNSR